jgi:hypothetical protein
MIYFIYMHMDNIEKACHLAETCVFFVLTTFFLMDST